MMAFGGWELDRESWGLGRQQSAFFKIISYYSWRDAGFSRRWDSYLQFPPEQEELGFESGSVLKRGHIVGNPEGWSRPKARVSRFGDGLGRVGREHVGVVRYLPMEGGWATSIDEQAT